MASGGARARSGPAADPDALRRDRKDDAATWKTLPGPRTDPAPEFPLPDVTERESVIWEREWQRPQAHEWARLGLDMEVALYVRAFAEAERPEATANLRNYVRMEQENLGLSINGLTRHRWIIGDSSAAATPASATTSASSTTRRSSRDRFTVVPPPEDDAPPF